MDIHALLIRFAEEGLYWDVIERDMGALGRANYALAQIEISPHAPCPTRVLAHEIWHVVAEMAEIPMSRSMSDFGEEAIELGMATFRESVSNGYYDEEDRREFQAHVAGFNPQRTLEVVLQHFHVPSLIKELESCAV